MTQISNSEATTAKPKLTKTSKAKASSPVRICARSRDKLDAMLARVNKDRFGRRVTADDLIGYGLDLLTDTHLEEIGTRLLSNKERIEIMYRKMVKARKGLTRDEFLGMLLEGKMAEQVGASVSLAAANLAEYGSRERL